MGNLCSFSISLEDTLSRCWDCVVGQASYTCKLEQNLEALSQELEKLKARRDDVNRIVDLAERQRMERLNEVELWLTRAGAMIAEVEELRRNAPQQTSKVCLSGCYSWNCKSSYKFGRQVARKLEEVIALKNEGGFDKVAENELAASILRPFEQTVGLESSLVEVLNLLEQKEVGMIGLYGLGGVGKTTLLTKIYNKLMSTRPNRFDNVIWAVVSKDHTIENVQAKIGEKLHLTSEWWNNKPPDEKSEDIHRILSRKKFVLLLDDIWERVDLIKVGVPLPDEKNGSKVVFTTRLIDVCGEMKANKKIEVRCLGENEAWTLFRQNVGEETLNSHENIPELAKMVVAECRGLPLALIVIGRAMTGKNSPGSWEFAIEVLRNSAHKFGKTAQDLYPVLKFSYDNLPSDRMRSCLLYCCLFSEDHSIWKSSLIEYWFCEGLLEMFGSIDKARKQGHYIIDSLLNASLLEKDGENRVKMHDVIRDMALWIACECEVAENKFFVQAGLQLKEAPEAREWEGVRRVSLMQNRIKCLISTPRSPNLQTLLLNDNELGGIENDFFQFMPNLRVLNLSGCWHLRKLPEGISELVSLECLNLSKTSIQELPIELKSLKRLKCLDLSKMHNLVRIPCQLLASFSKLQVFRIYNVGHLCSADKKEEDKVSICGEHGEDLIAELGSLQKLNDIHIEMKGASALTGLLSFPNLQRCTEDLMLWNYNEEVLNVSYLANMESLKGLSLYHCEDVEEVKIERESKEGQMLRSPLFPTKNILCFHSLQLVHLYTCGKLKDMTWLILASNLKILSVDTCAEMEEILKEERLAEVAELVGNPSPNPFPKLEKLLLNNLPELKRIYGKALPFPHLTEIRVEYCSKLKKLPLNSDSAKEKDLTITGTITWWEDIEWEDEATRNVFLHRFKRVS